MNKWQKFLFFLTILFCGFFFYELYTKGIQFKNFIFLGILIGLIFLTIYLKEIASFIQIIVGICIILSLLFLVTDIIYDNKIGWGVRQFFELFSNSLSNLQIFTFSIISEILIILFLNQFCISREEELIIELKEIINKKDNIKEQAKTLIKEAEEIKEEK